MRPQDLQADYRDGRITRRQFVEGSLKLGLTVTGAASLLAACHRKGTKAAPKRLTGRVQILIGFHGGNTAAQRQVQQTLAEAFIAAHPQVGIDFLRAASAAAAQSQLQTLVQRGAAPDIVLGVDLADVARLADRHLWLDLRPLFQRDGVATGAFAASAMAAAGLSGYYGSTKALPGVPLGVANHALAYNVDLFAKAGLPAPPASWSDGTWALSTSFLQAAQTLTVDTAGRHAGQSGFDIAKVARFGAGRIRPEAIYFSFGGHLYNSSKRQAELNSPAAIAGAQFAGDLVARYHALPNPAQLAALGATGGKGDDELAAWRAGKLAMIDLCSCEINSPYGTKVPFAWKAAALPTGPARRFGVLEVSLGSIVASSTNHDLAWEVLKFFAIDPANERTLAVGGFDTTPALAVNADGFAAATKQGAGVDPVVWSAGLPSSSAENDGWIPAFADVHAIVSAALVTVAGGTAAATVMPQAQQQAQAKIDAWFKVNKLPK